MEPKLKQLQTAGRMKTWSLLLELCWAHAGTLREGKSGHFHLLQVPLLEPRVSDRAIAKMNQP
jgi:hypothetical protein